MFSTHKYAKYIIASVAIIGFYFAFRLLNIMYLPMFTDEAIYVRWAQIALQDSAQRFISLTDGKQPSYIWITAIFIKFIQDPLLAGRLVSVFAGFGSIVGLWFLTYELFKSRKAAFVTSILYVFYPFAQVHDRLAIYDSLVACIYIWTTYVSILLVRYIRFDLAFVVGILTGIGLLTKTGNIASLYLLPFTLLLLKTSRKALQPLLLRWVLCAIIIVVISQGMYAILRLSPLFHMIAQKNTEFIYPFSVGLKPPFQFLIGNMTGLLTWLFDYLTPFYIVLVIGSLITVKIFWKEKLLLLIYCFAPMLGLALVGKVIYPRFIFFMSVMLLPMAGIFLIYVSNFLQKRIRRAVSYEKKWYGVTAVLLLFFISYPFYVSYLFATNPVKAPITRSDSVQYVNSWTSGWGLIEAVAFLKRESVKEPIFVGTQGTFGLLPFGLEIYLVNDPNITIRGYWPVGETLPDEVLEKAKTTPTYFIIYQPPLIRTPTTMPLEKVFQRSAGNSDYRFRVYKVNKQS